MSRLLHQRTTKEFFKIPYTEEQVRDMLTASYMAEVAYRHLPYINDDGTVKYIDIASKWLHSPKTPGLILCGMPGNGKTTLVKAIQTLINSLNIKDDYGRICGISLLNARELARLSKEKYESFKNYMTKPMLAIDDLGVEPMEVLSYGNVINPVIELLSYRYDEQLLTIVSTNLRPQEIREKYKDRIADRFNEMMTKIVFETRSFRGRKV